MSEATAPALIARYASHTLDCMFNATMARTKRGERGYERDWMRKEACTCGLRALLAANSVDERLLQSAEEEEVNARRRKFSPNKGGAHI